MAASRLQSQRCSFVLTVYSVLEVVRVIEPFPLAHGLAYFAASLAVGIPLLSVFRKFGIGVSS